MAGLRGAESFDGLRFDGRRPQYGGNRRPQNAIYLKPPSGQIVIDVSLHHACFAKGHVGAAEHVLGDFLRPALIS
jgi:hypothetical protein